MIEPMIVRMKSRSFPPHLSVSGTGAVTDFDSITNEIDINGSGKKTVTVLNIESSGITFSGYKGVSSLASSQNT